MAAPGCLRRNREYEGKNYLISLNIGDAIKFGDFRLAWTGSAVRGDLVGLEKVMVKMGLLPSLLPSTRQFVGLFVAIQLLGFSNALLCQKVEPLPLHRVGTFSTMTMGSLNSLRGGSTLPEPSLQEPSLQERGSWRWILNLDTGNKIFLLGMLGMFILFGYVIVVPLIKLIVVDVMKLIVVDVILTVLKGLEFGFMSAGRAATIACVRIFETSIHIGHAITNACNALWPYSSVENVGHVFGMVMFLAFFPYLAQSFKTFVEIGVSAWLGVQARV